ncbi:MAG: hypothetical protein RLZZ292_2437 [Bacteroidota bacterium]|jgi:hypothetical protein
MQHIAQHLREILATALPLLQGLNDQKTSEKPSPSKWSQKEIVGHLIDSAGNNQQKFVRTMAQSHTDFVGYAQEFWVTVQVYNEANWSELVQTWYGYNLQIAHIIAHVQPETLGNTICIDGKGPFTLQYIMEDYNEHLKHHLHQIFPDFKLESAFVNRYHV